MAVSYTPTLHYGQYGIAMSPILYCGYYGSAIHPYTALWPLWHCHAVLHCTIATMAVLYSVGIYLQVLAVSRSTHRCNHDSHVGFVYSRKSPLPQEGGDSKGELLHPSIIWSPGVGAASILTPSQYHNGEKNRRLEEPSRVTAVHEPSAKYYELSRLHGRWGTNRAKTWMWVEDHEILPVLEVSRQ